MSRLDHTTSQNHSLKTAKNKGTYSTGNVPIRSNKLTQNNNQTKYEKMTANIIIQKNN